jgi:phosphatidylinositol glycan class V
MKPVDISCSRHLVLITVTFVAWKALLGLVTHGSPGIGYDTSSSLLEDFETPLELTETPSNLHYFATKLIRWDAIYFVQIAARSYVFEQEWAFSYAFSKIISTVSSGMLRVHTIWQPANSCSH